LLAAFLPKAMQAIIIEEMRNFTSINIRRNGDDIFVENKNYLFL
jgi:hypothetical protein